MNTITFQVSKTKEIEPIIFTYGIVIESENTIKTKLSINENIKNRTQIKMESLPDLSYIIPEKDDDLFLIQIFKITGRNELDHFTSSLNQIDGIRGGIISTDINNEEKEELDLIQELTEVARGKAEQYAKLCNQALLGITSFKVISSNQVGWKAYPPINKLTKESIYSSILMKYGKNDKFEISRTVEVQFEIK